MSRLLTLLLLYRAGYIVGKYISMEMLIEKTKDTYYEALQASSLGWHDNKNDYQPFVIYYLGIILKAYAEFESRISYLTTQGLSKPERIKALIDGYLGKFTKKRFNDTLPGYQQNNHRKDPCAASKRWLYRKNWSWPQHGLYPKITNNQLQAIHY